MRNWWFATILVGLQLVISTSARADSAEQLFARYEPALLQVRVLEPSFWGKSCHWQRLCD